MSESPSRDCPADRLPPAEGGLTAEGRRHLTGLVRTVPDWPKPGIQFRDISTLLIDRHGFARVLDALIARYRYTPIDKVVAIESRGFMIGGPLAFALGCGFVMARKPNKLPAKVRAVEYQLEYGSDRIEIHVDAVGPGDRCLVVDDLLATGGTAAATCDLVRQLGGTVVGCAFVINLPDLGGTERLAGYDTHWLIDFAGD